MTFNIKTYLSKSIYVLLLFCGSFLLMSMDDLSGETKIPSTITKGFKIALSYYPELQNADIQIRLKKQIKSATMQARPTFASVFKSKEKRTYTIWVSEHFLIDGEEFLIKDAPQEVLIGWLGHELGHILDYKDRSNWQMIRFGINYLFSDAHITQTERTADIHTIAHGMEGYLVQTKNYILDQPNLSQTYRDRFEKYYLNADEIAELADEMEAADGL